MCRKMSGHLRTVSRRRAVTPTSSVEATRCGAILFLIFDIVARLVIESHVSAQSCLSDAPCLSNLRPSWRGWLISCAWAIAASMRPLDVHEYVVGSQSCDADLKRKTPPTVFRQIGRVWHPGGVRRDARDLGLAPVRRAVPPASLIVESRRITSSRDTAPRPARRFAARPANRSAPSHSARHSATRSAPQLVFSLHRP